MGTNPPDRNKGGGPVRTNVTKTDFGLNTEIKPGFETGLSYDCFFNKAFSAGAGLVYDQRGFVNNEHLVLTDAEGIPLGEINEIDSYYYDYLSIPLNIGYNCGETFFGFANAGVTPAFLVDAKIVLSTLAARQTTKSVNTTGRVNRFDLGGKVELGGGYKFTNKYWLFPSVSYQHGFTSITNADYFKDSEIRHNGIALNSLWV